MIAAEKGNIALVEAITTQNANLNYNQKDIEDKTEIFYAIQGGQEENVDVVSRLAARGSKFTGIYDSTGFTPLLLAVKLDKVAIVEELLRLEANANEATKNQGDTALHLACLEGNLELIKLLVAYGADQRLVSKRKETPREVAAKKGHQVIVDYLKQLEEELKDVATQATNELVQQHEKEQLTTKKKEQQRL